MFDSNHFSHISPLLWFSINPPLSSVINLHLYFQPKQENPFGEFCKYVRNHIYLPPANSTSSFGSETHFCFCHYSLSVSVSFFLKLLIVFSAGIIESSYIMPSPFTLLCVITLTFHQLMLLRQKIIRYYACTHNHWFLQQWKQTKKNSMIMWIQMTRKYVLLCNVRGVISCDCRYEFI